MISLLLIDTHDTIAVLELVRSTDFSKQSFECHKKNSVSICMLDCFLNRWKFFFSSKVIRNVEKIVCYNRVSYILEKLKFMKNIKIARSWWFFRIFHERKIFFNEIETRLTWTTSEITGAIARTRIKIYQCQFIEFLSVLRTKALSRYSDISFYRLIIFYAHFCSLRKICWQLLFLSLILSHLKTSSELNSVFLGFSFLSLNIGMF